MVPIYLLIYILGLICILVFFVIVPFLVKLYLREYRLKIFLFYALIFVFLGIYSLLTLIGNMIQDLSLASIIFDLSVIFIYLVAATIVVTLRYLRRASIGTYTLLILGILGVLKVYSLIQSPVKVYFYRNITVREAHIAPLSLSITLIIFSLCLAEFFLFIDSALKIPSKKSYAKKILLLEIPTAFMLYVYTLSLVSTEIALAIPYLQAINTGYGTFMMLFVFRKKPEKIAFITINVKAYFLYTTSGIEIIRRRYDESTFDIIEEYVSIFKNFLAIEKESAERTEIALKHALSQQIGKDYLLYFIGTKYAAAFISNRDNLLLREMLVNIVKDFERRDPLAGIEVINDEDVKIALEISEKYLSIII